MIETKINKKTQKILSCKEKIQLEGEGSYIVNHKLKQIAGPYTNILNVIDKAFTVCRNIRNATNMSNLLLDDNTCIVDKDYNDYIHLTINGNIKDPKYNSKDDINLIYSKCGVYAIKSDKLNTMYIGETIKTFHERWLRHYNNPMKQIELLLNQDDVEFIIIKCSLPDKQLTLKLEEEAILYYKKNTNMKIIGGRFEKY